MSDSGNPVVAALVILPVPLGVAGAAAALRLGLLDEFVDATRPVVLLGAVLLAALFVRVKLGRGSSGGRAATSAPAAAVSSGGQASGGRPRIHVHGAPGRHYANLTAEQRRTGSHLPAAERASVRAHEERHHRAARALGADGWWEYTPDGGATFYQTNDDHLTPVEQAATAYAGNGGSWWAHSGRDEGDQACANWWINKLPRSERGDAHRAARALAKRIS